MSLALESTDLRKDYAGEHALDGVSIAVEAGAIFGLIGADGAGKTTLLRILTTLIAPDAGTGSVLGFDIARDTQQIRSAIGYMPQRFSLYEDLTVRENMLFFADVFGVRGKERSARLDRLLQFSRLGPFQSRRARNLSGGMKQKLALSCALIHTPRLLILDEPTTGVDPVSRREFWAILKDLRGQGITIVVSTPYMDEAEFCDNLALLHAGRVIATGSPSELLAQYPLRLYEVRGGDRAISLPARSPLPAAVALAYPSGGGLRIATSSGPDAAPGIFEEVKRLVPDAQSMQPTDATAEDLFFYHLSVAGTAGDAAPPAPSPQKRGHHFGRRGHH